MEWIGALRLAPTPVLMHQARRTLPRTVNCNAQGQSHARAAAAAAASAPAYTEAAVAPPLGQPSSPDAEHSQARNDNIPLGTADLEAFCQQRGISAALVPALGGKPPPPGCVEVKSLLFLVNNHPVVSNPQERGNSLGAPLLVVAVLLPRHRLRLPLLSGLSVHICNSTPLYEASPRPPSGPRWRCCRWQPGWTRNASPSCCTRGATKCGWRLPAAWRSCAATRVREAASTAEPAGAAPPRMLPCRQLLHAV